MHAVYPRQGALYGAVKERKPWAEVFWCRDKKAILAESGYDSFPYAVPRLDVEEGSPYGTGLAWWVLPEALVLNALQTGVENAAELRLNPPILYPARMFGKPLDRRPGAANAYDATGLGFQNAQQALYRLDIGGDVAVGEQRMARMEANIEQAFFTDWMRLRDSGVMTAEEVRERRDMRIRALSSFVPGVDRDLMGPTASRTLEVMKAEGQVPPPPAQLSRAEVDWDFAGPLAIAQLKGQAQSLSDLFDQALKGTQLDPIAAYAVNVEEGLRAVNEALGNPPETLRSREDVEQHRQQEAKAQQLQRTLEAAQAGGAALRDGGQGAATLAGAMGGGQQQQPMQQAA